MQEQLPLDQTILTVLAWAAVEPQLTDSKRAAVSALLDKVTPDVDGLAKFGVELWTLLRSETAFCAARQQLGDLIPQRHALTVSKINQMMANSGPALGADELQSATLAAKNLAENFKQVPQVRDEPERTLLLQRLAALVGLTWPLIK